MALMFVDRNLYADYSQSVSLCPSVIFDAHLQVICQEVTQSPPDGAVVMLYDITRLVKVDRTNFTTDITPANTKHQ